LQYERNDTEVAGTQKAIWGNLFVYPMGMAVMLVLMAIVGLLSHRGKKND
jgi:hypothetical protein